MPRQIPSIIMKLSMYRNGLFACVLLIFGGQALAGDVDKKEAHLSASRLPHRPIPLILDMVHHNPGDKRYDSQFNDPTFIKKMGFNGKVYFLFDSPMLAVDWQSVDKSLMPEGSPARKWWMPRQSGLTARLPPARNPD